MLRRVGLVVPVAPYGRAAPQRSWRAFQAETGIPVVIDGAASMAELAKGADEYLGPLLVALSFHATKCFGVGEGGAIVSTDTAAVARAARALNFGFMGSRDSAVGSTNGKMSEFHAAVGLAELDGWERKMTAFRAVAQDYQDQFAAVGLAARVRAFPDVAPNYVLFECASATEASTVQACLEESKIDSRRWYGEGLQAQTYFATAPRDRLDIAESLAKRLLGLPVAVDLTGDDIARVVAAVRSGVLRTKQSTLTPLP